MSKKASWLLVAIAGTCAALALYASVLKSPAHVPQPAPAPDDELPAVSTSTDPTESVTRAPEPVTSTKATSTKGRADAKPAPVVSPEPIVVTEDISVSNVIALTNRERAGLGLATLKHDARLDAGAQAKAEDMAAKSYFAHASPDGTKFSDWPTRAGYTWKIFGENLAEGYRTASKMHAAWMASPTHRANIVSIKYHDVGVGIAEGKYDGRTTTFVVVEFGTAQ